MVCLVVDFVCKFLRIPIEFFIFSWLQCVAGWIGRRWKPIKLRSYRFLNWETGICLVCKRHHSMTSIVSVFVHLIIINCWQDSQLRSRWPTSLNRALSCWSLHWILWVNNLVRFRPWLQNVACKLLWIVNVMLAFVCVVTGWFTLELVFACRFECIGGCTVFGEEQYLETWNWYSCVEWRAASTVLWSKAKRYEPEFLLRFTSVCLLITQARAIYLYQRCNLILLSII